VLTRLRVSPTGRTQGELRSDPQCGGTVVAIKKALQRLIARGLVTTAVEPHPEKKGTKVNRYFAVLSRDMCGSKCPPTPKASQVLEIVGGQGVGVSPHSEEDLEPQKAAGANHAVELPKVGGHRKACPPTLPSVDADSEWGDTISVTPQETERSKTEINTLIEDARNFWS
jgi:hypothetical protein